MCKTARTSYGYPGNGMAHGDYAEAVSQVDADLTVALMDEVYQAPARVARPSSSPRCDC